MDKYNEAGVPITWARLVSMNMMFEKKAWIPPLPQGEKVPVVLPLKSVEENLIDLEQQIKSILIKKINQTLEKFTLPIRLADI
jgi:hypothetical protein